MSQNDFTIANQTFPNTRADINSALQALASTSSGSSAPSTTFANQFFYNTTSNLLQIRNEGNDAYITIAELDQTNDTVEYFKSDSVRTALIEFTDGDDALAIADGGALTVSTSLDMNGTELILDADADTSITADTDDRIDIKVGGADVAHITKNVIGGIINRENATPFLINGDFKIAQRATSVSGINATGLAVVDRWGYVIGDAGTWTAERANDGPANNGFPQCFKWDCTTAKGTLGTNTIMYIRQILEAQDVQLFNIAQSTAKPFTVTFWVRSTKTGTYICMLNNFTANRHVSKAYTISSSNTWEKKTVSFPADTAGSIGNTNGAGISVNFWVAAGSTYSSGTLQQAWGGAANANQAVGQVNAADSTSNFFSLTGVQLEVGEYDSTTIPPFQHEEFGCNLYRCMRYYRQSYSIGTKAGTPSTQVGATMVYIPTTGNTLRYTLGHYGMRATPTFAEYSPETGTAGIGSYESSGDTNAEAISTTFANEHSTLLFNTAMGFVGSFYWQYTLSAEL